MAMRAETRETGISGRVKRCVWTRDGGQCIICGSTHASPNAHYIPRSQGGRGIEENIVTLCANCHRNYDQSGYRRAYGNVIQAYLKSCYPGMKEEDLIYSKYKRG